MFERFTDRARRVLVLAQEEARDGLSHNYIGTEHILLGLIAEREGVAAKVLESCGVSLEKARAKVAETLGPAARASTTGSPPFTPRAKKVLELGLREALQLGHNYIGTEHILLGLVREGEGVGAQVITSLCGGGLPRVRQEVIEMLGAPGGWTKMVGPPVRRFRSPSGRKRPPAGVQRGTWRTPSGEPPDCPTCGASLANRARLRKLALASAEEPQVIRLFDVVYCDACGASLAFVPAD